MIIHEIQPVPIEIVSHLMKRVEWHTKTQESELMQKIQFLDPFVRIFFCKIEIKNADSLYNKVVFESDSILVNHL